MFLALGKDVTRRQTAYSRRVTAGADPQSPPESRDLRLDCRSRLQYKGRMRRQGSILRLALACATVALAAAPGATAATLEAPACVGNDAHATPTLPVSAMGFVPGSFVSLRYEAGYLGEPRSAGLFRPDGAGAFAADLVPPTLAALRVNRRQVTLRAVDPLMPGLEAIDEITVVRTRVRVVPRASRNPARNARFFAEGFASGRILYAHFRRFGSNRARSVRLGRAAGPCGRVVRRMSLVPGSGAAPGSWSVDVDESPTWSPSTRPQTRTGILVKRR